MEEETLLVRVEIASQLTIVSSGAPAEQREVLGEGADSFEGKTR